MRIDFNTPVDILMHGEDIHYIDLDEGELMHWKYIKREKLPNGKWRYYYDQSELDAAKSASQQAQQQQLNDAYKSGSAKAKLNFAYERYHEKNLNPSKIQEAKQNYETAHKKMKASAAKAKKAEKKYRTMKIKSFPARAISKGIVKIANIGNGTNKKKKQNRTKISVSTSFKGYK